MNLDLDFTFRSPSYLIFRRGKSGFTDHNDEKRQIIVEPVDPNNYNMKVLRDGDVLLTVNNTLFSAYNMRIMERSLNRIVLQDWDENEDREPITHNELTINYKKNQVYNCILNLRDDDIIYVFLNESELSSQIYLWDYNSYHPDKNGVFKERLMNGYYNEWTFVNNQKHGEWRAYTRDGRIIEKGHYHLGKPEGEYTEYYGNSRIRYTWIYKNGRRNGFAKYYNSDGFLILEGNYLNDKQVSKWVTYNNKGEFESFDDFGEKGKPLFFHQMGGSGSIVCRECGHEKKLISHLHGFSVDLKDTISTLGYQCQKCGKFQERRSTPQKREIDLACECGGQIDREKPLFCLKCKSYDLEYHGTFIT
jgi:hypothetical protein